MKHTKGDAHRKGRRKHIAQRRGAQEGQAHHKRHFANAVIESPAYKRPDDHSYKGKGCRADACDGPAATQALDKEREGGEAHDVVGEDAEVHTRMMSTRSRAQSLAAGLPACAACSVDIKNPFWTGLIGPPSRD